MNLFTLFLVLMTFVGGGLALNGPTDAPLPNAGVVEPTDVEEIGDPCATKKCAEAVGCPSWCHVKGCC